MKLTVYIFSLFAFLAISCQRNPHTKAEIETAMRHYDSLILHTNATALADCYTLDGMLGDAAKGRDSIRRFLEKYQSIKVLEQSSVSDSIFLNADTAIQKGRYRQADRLPGGDTVHVKGSYTAKWVWNKQEGWRIKQMNTVAE